MAFRRHDINHDWSSLHGRALRLSAAQVVATDIDIENGDLMLDVGLRSDGPLP